MVREARWKEKGRWFDSRPRHKLSFWNFRIRNVVHISAKTIQMKSSMTFIQSNGCTGIDLILKQIWRRFKWWQVSFKSRFTIYHYTSMHTHIQCMYTCFRCARNLYYANRFCRVLPRSKCYSSKTCLMCIICTLEYARCSNGTMNNTSTLILWYRLLKDLRALMNL